MNDVKHLNTALKGEHMAILGFDHYINDIKDSIVKEKLQDIQKRHKRQAIRIAEKIQELKGNPVDTAGLAGSIQEIKYKILPKSHQNNDIIENAIEGEKMGVRALNDLLSNLSEDSSQMIKLISAENSKIIEELYSLKQ